MNIGADVYLEMPFKEALEMIDNKLYRLNQKLEILNLQIIKNKAYIKLTLGLIGKIKNESYY